MVDSWGNLQANSQILGSTPRGLHKLKVQVLEFPVGIQYIQVYPQDISNFFLFKTSSTIFRLLENHPFPSGA